MKTLKRLLTAALTIILLLTCVCVTSAATATYYRTGESPARDVSVMYDPPSGYYYAYSEGGGRGGYFKVQRSADMVTWENAGSVLAADDVRWGYSSFSSLQCYYNPDTCQYFLFYSARIKTGSDAAETHFGEKQYARGDKIGVAVSNTPTGPFTDIANTPIDFFPYDNTYYDVDKVMKNALTPPTSQNTSCAQGVYISCTDPALLFDGDSIYLYFTRESYRHWVWDSTAAKYVAESSICCVELTTNWWNSADGSVNPTVVASAVNASKPAGDTSTARKDGFTELLTYATEPQTWENVESSSSPYAKRLLSKPDVVKKSADINNDGTPETRYYLYYTCNGTNAASSAIGYAVSTSPTSGWNKYSANPVIYSRNGMTDVSGGNPALSPDGTELYYVYQAKTNGKASARIRFAR